MKRRMMTKRMTKMKVKVRMRKTTTSLKKTSKNPDLAVARRKRSTRKTRSTSATRKTRSVDRRTRVAAKRRTRSADARKTLARTAMPQPHLPLLPPLSQQASQSLKPPSKPTTVRRACFPLRPQPTKTIFCSNNFCKESELNEPSLKVTTKMSKCFTGGSRISCIVRGN
jgi:hypothetical protein